MNNITQSNNVLYGNRIPRDFFITKGKGESDITIHAGSYHLALKDADNIHQCNIITYSSILPGIAKEVIAPKKFVHGSVMETIMAVANKEKGETCTVGIIFGWLYNKKSNKKYGGLVCEYNGSLTKEEAEDQLQQSLNELYTNGYSEGYFLKDIKMTSESFIPQKRYGTALVALCFINYIYPEFK
jgi:arginine decarboxylase